MGPSLEVVEGVSRMMIELNLIRLRSCTKGGMESITVTGVRLTLFINRSSPKNFPFWH